MDFYEKIRTLPTLPGVYLYKNALGEVIYVGKARNLRSRVRSYLLAANQMNAKTGTLMREAVDLDYILVANEMEALALENNLIKQRKPRFNILLRDDKTYPYVKLTMGDRFPKVFVTRRLRKDGSAYYGPYFPGNLAYRVAEVIHRSFLIPSCKVDLSRYHPRACLQYYIHRCLGPCVKELTTPEIYAGAVKDAQLFLEGRHAELERSLHGRMTEAAEAEQFELAGRYRDLISTVHQLEEKQRMATADSDDADVFGYHYEGGCLAANLFHIRSGKIVDRREFFWEDLPEFLVAGEEIASGAAEAEEESEIGEESPLELSSGAKAPLTSAALPARLKSCPVREPGEASASVKSPAPGADFGPSGDDFGASEGDFGASRDDFGASKAGFEDEPELAGERTFDAGQFFSALLKQLYIDQQYVPRTILTPVDFEDRETLAGLLAARTGHRVEVAAPQRGDKRSLIDLAGQNAKQSYTQRFRVLEPSRKAIQEALADALMLPELPRRIECFDVSHIQGAETVASMVVWEDGAMKKAAYRKFQVKTVVGVDDFASMREVVLRRYKRVKEEGGEMPSLILIDGGLGQLHAAFQALEELGFTSQPLASIAKREEVIYVHGNEEEPVVLDRRSPVLHLVQMIRDESHRFAIGYHRKRREMRDRDSELLAIPGVGAQTRQRLLTHFGSLREVREATAESLAAVVSRKTAASIWEHFHARTPGS